MRTGNSFINQYYLSINYEKLKYRATFKSHNLNKALQNDLNEAILFKKLNDD